MGKAYETARTGGKHHGWYRISQDLGDRQIEKSIRSFQEQVRRHQAWIADAYAKLPRNASAAQVSMLVKSGWPEDIERHLEFIDILKGILKERSKMTPSKQQVVIEELLTAAIDAGMKARRKAAMDPFENGRVSAYYDVIRWIKEQADILEIEFADQSLAKFDPDELLKPEKQAA